jgi:hypothetical protein
MISSQIKQPLEVITSRAPKCQFGEDHIAKKQLDTIAEFD